MTAINITDLNNAKADVDHIAAVATSPALTVTDRFGGVKPTVRGALKTLQALNLRGAFVTATSYTAKDVYTSGATAYVALADHVSTSVAADLAAGRVAVYQGVTSEALAGPNGTLEIGNGYGVSSGGVELPPNPLTVFVRSSPIPLVTAITGGAMVTDASVDYSTPFQAVLNYLRDFGGGKIILPPKTRIKAFGLTAYTGIEIEGYDWTTVLEVPAGSHGIFVNPGTGGTTSIDGNQRNIAMRGFKVKGPVATAGFFEFAHLLGFSATSHSELVDMNIEGFQGDGVYLGSGYVANTERHNYKIKIIGGRIDGVNNDNRNGISVIDCDGLEIDGVDFRNCTRSNMPGAIDMEPNAVAYAIIKNIGIRKNTFSNCGGNVGLIGVIHPAAVVADVENLTIEENVAKASIHSAAFFAFNNYRAPTATSGSNNVRLINNKSTGGAMSLALYSGKGITSQGDVYSDHTMGALIGYSAATNVVRSVSFIDTDFLRQASGGGSGLNVFKADDLKFVRTKLIDCGNGVAGSANGMIFQPGASSYVSFDGLEISTPTGKTLIGIQKDLGHTLNGATNKFYRSDLNGLANNFVAADSDTLETVYLPTIGGSTTEGVGTYPVQFGRWRKVGKLTFFRVYLSVAAGHTGTGAIQLSLPINSKAVSNGERHAVSVSLSGVASSGGHAGLHTYAPTINGVRGAILMTQQAAGTQAVISIPAGAFLVHASGWYEAD